MHTNFAIKKPALHLQPPLDFNIHKRPDREIPGQTWNIAMSEK